MVNATEIFGRVKHEIQVVSKVIRDFDKRVLINIPLAILALPFFGFLNVPKGGLDPHEGFRYCGLTEDTYKEGLKEFFEIANIGFQLDASSNRRVPVNKGQPGTKGYVYPGRDGIINPGDQVAGSYSVCQMNMNTGGVQLFFYKEIGTKASTQYTGKKTPFRHHGKDLLIDEKNRFTNKKSAEIPRNKRIFPRGA